MIANGTVYSEGRFFKGYVEFDEGVITEVVEGAPKGRITTDGLIIPMLANCHTHIGDTSLRGKIDSQQTLEELVRPPDGLKHKLLSQQSEKTMVGAMGEAIIEMRALGIGRYIDFREDGLQGLQHIKDAIRIHPYPKPIVLARPRKIDYSEDEVEELIGQSDGIGISAMRDWPYDELLMLAGHVKRRKKMFALHASEGEREDISSILKLEPDFLVHMSCATEDDLLACKDAGIPIVVCPRSNTRFGIRLDITRMLDLGIDVCIGTDNAMLHDLSVIEEFRAAYSLSGNRRRLDAAEVFKLAVENSRKVLYDKGVITIAAGNPCEFMVLKVGKNDSPEELMRAGCGHSIELVSIGSKTWKSEEWKRSRGS
jgi:cytosine/adenosine deaminase-related metal-dependent hydrolase